MANLYGRQVVVPLTNKSGGGVIAGDVVVLDSSNNDAFTTSTAGAVTSMVGVAQETIANNAVGRVLTAGYAALVNVNASVTRGNYGKTHTVAKQATDAGSSRVVGAFCQFLTAGTTPDAHLFGFPDASTGAGGAPATATYITTTSDATLSAEVPRPELDDFSLSGASNIDFTSPTSDNAALTFLTDQTGIAKVIQCTDTATRRHAYVSSAIGTANFDIRARIIAHDISSPHTAASTGFCGLFVADSSLTTGTRLSVQVSNQSAAADTNVPQAIAVDGTGGVGTAIFGVKFPILLRIVRSGGSPGTTITRYCSVTEGRTWMQLGATTTSSLSVGRLGILAEGGSTGTQTSVTLVHWIRSF